jgi:hypothetical protein
MTAFNVVRTRVKPGQEAAFMAVHEQTPMDMAGLRRLSVIKTGEREFCLIGEWDSFEDLAAARPRMIGVLDTFRHTLEDLGEGVTDPVSGEVVLERTP